LCTGKRDGWKWQAISTIILFGLASADVNTNLGFYYIFIFGRQTVAEAKALVQVNIAWNLVKILAQLVVQFPVR
jgi:hypothetical protein